MVLLRIGVPKHHFVRLRTVAGTLLRHPGLDLIGATGRLAVAILPAIDGGHPRGSETGHVHDRVAAGIQALLHEVPHHLVVLAVGQIARLVLFRKAIFRPILKLAAFRRRPVSPLRLICRDPLLEESPKRLVLADARLSDHG